MNLRERKRGGPQIKRLWVWYHSGRKDEEGRSLVGLDTRWWRREIGFIHDLPPFTTVSKRDWKEMVPEWLGDMIWDVIERRVKEGWEEGGGRNGRTVWKPFYSSIVRIEMRREEWKKETKGRRQKERRRRNEWEERRKGQKEFVSTSYAWEKWSRSTW